MIRFVGLCIDIACEEFLPKLHCAFGVDDDRLEEVCVVHDKLIEIIRFASYPGRALPEGERKTVEVASRRCRRRRGGGVLRLPTGLKEKTRKARSLLFLLLLSVLPFSSSYTSLLLFVQSEPGPIYIYTYTFALSGGSRLEFCACAAIVTTVGDCISQR